MSTYSINISTSTESTSNTDIQEILNNLPDNLDKEISPRDIRNAVISDWDVPSFKETKPASSSISYIGIDTGNTTSRDIKMKIYFGKRELNGSVIMSTFSFPDLINSDSADIFLYNTKIDTHSQLKTRISILAGSNHNFYDISPYIQSQVVTGTAGQSLSLDLINQSGDISLKSDYGTVSINGAIFPTIVSNNASASNNKVLRYNENGLYWDDISVSFYNTVGVTGSELNIFGTPVLVNNNPIEYTNAMQTPKAFNGVSMGRSFDNMPIVEVIREILYPYLPPICSLFVNQSVAEFGTFPTISLNYSVTKRTLDINSTILINMMPSSIPPISSTSYVTVTGTVSGIYIPNSNTIFTITATDGTQSISASQSLSYIYPYFTGLLNSYPINLTGLPTLNKLVEANGDKTIGLVGSGYIYFIYDSNYPLLTRIFDDNNEIYGPSSSMTSFTYSTVTLTSPDWLWASHQFKVYRSISSYLINPPSVNYQFKY